MSTAPSHSLSPLTSHVSHLTSHFPPLTLNSPDFRAEKDLNFADLVSFELEKLSVSERLARGRMELVQHERFVTLLKELFYREAGLGAI
jgi:hypothetical protein